MFVSPYKLGRNLATMRSVLGDVEVVICKELTKIYEEVWRGKISQAEAKFTKLKGEFVLLFHL